MSIEKKDDYPVLPIGIGILAWNSGAILERTLNSYRQNGLFEMVESAVILFQCVSEYDRKIAQNFDLPCIGLENNIGIGSGFSKLAANLNSKYIILLEHDWLLLEGRDIVYDRLREAVFCLESGYTCVRLRHRKNPGVPLFSEEVYKGKELTVFDECTGLVSPHLLDCIHWRDSPEIEFADKIRKFGSHFSTSSRYGNWTNNPCLFERLFYSNLIQGFEGSGDDLERKISRYWALQNYQVAHGEGLFTHYHPEKYNADPKSFLMRLKRKLRLMFT